MKVLITGFDPFGKETINPAIEAVKLLPEKIENHKIIKLEIPTVFQKSISILEKAIAKEKPDIVICVGQAGGREKISVERIAINIDDSRIEDNEGNKPIDRFIFEDGDDGYFSTLPIKAIVKNLKKENIPSEVSNTAGTFLCNHLMYGLMYLIHKKNLKIKGGFIHIPYLPSQVLDKNMPSMSLDLSVKGLEIAIKTSLKYDEDLKISEGKLH